MIESRVKGIHTVLAKNMQAIREGVAIRETFQQTGENHPGYELGQSMLKLADAEKARALAVRGPKMTGLWLLGLFRHQGYDKAMGQRKVAVATLSALADVATGAIEITRSKANGIVKSSVWMYVDDPKDSIADLTIEATPGDERRVPAVGFSPPEVGFKLDYDKQRALAWVAIAAAQDEGQRDVRGVAFNWASSFEPASFRMVSAQ